ncbi:RNA ligase [Nesterenkonia flava]|uniref:RNA ligase n=1 Tax=Nesterenkonia flava TaxID=469799 RepID=A0ABU1FRY2_9MICC|nr:RNA ligase [Nesterenkonia flava]MDR5711425.1 RNA ligase [Nesterenkonia flava]
MHIDALVPPDMLAQDLEDKMIRRTSNPDGTKHLYVYTEQAQYKRHWNDATINCRGLVVDAEGRVMARPFPKFFNYGEHPEGSLNLGDMVDVYDKLDGSLAVLATDETITSKGSFTSHVADQARKVYAEKYAGRWERDSRLTYCFECIWPEGRIVLDYGATEDLILLGAVDIETGQYHLPHMLREWRGPKAEHFGTMTLAQALEIPPRRNAEGLVIYVHETSTLIKIKQEDYLALHRIITGTSAITVWEALSVKHLESRGAEKKHIVQMLGIGPDRVQAALDLRDDWETEMAERVPDEFHQWLRDTAEALRQKAHHLGASAHYFAMLTAARRFTDKKSAVLYLQQQQPQMPEGLRWNTVLNTLTPEFTVPDEAPTRVAGDIWKTIRPHGATWSMKGEL